MFTDEPTHFKPPRESHRVAIGLFVVIAIAIGLYFTSERISRDRRMPQLERGSASPPMARPDGAPRPERRRDAAGADRTPPSPWPQVPIGADPDGARPLSRQPAPDVTERPRPPPLRTTLYLCKRYAGGAMFWTTVPCSNRSATIERMTSVPGGLPFDEQVAIARREAEEAATLSVVPPPATAGGIGSQLSVPESIAACAALAQQVRAIDAAAREPQSAQVQDLLARERRTVRDRQHRLRC